jgi:hypothetical protein
MVGVQADSLVSLRNMIGLLLVVEPVGIIDTREVALDQRGKAHRVHPGITGKPTA